MYGGSGREKSGKKEKEKKRVRVRVWRRKKQGKKGNYMDKKNNNKGKIK